MKLAVTQSLYTYWNGLRRDRVAPRRFEIEPSCIAGFLPDTFILELADRKSMRFRLAGTRISDALGVDLRNTNLFDLFEAEDRTAIEGEAAQIIAQGAVGLFEIEAADETRRAASFEMLILPLTHMGDTIDRFLGSIAPVNKPEWLGSVALTKRRLVKQELIWPDGRPRRIEEAMQRQTPFRPGVREAKIVRFQRRQFRVYEGGLNAPKR